jgi:ABC-type nitrate/sulfonate/bicarbonate transport system permease component
MRGALDVRSVLVGWGMLFGIWTFVAYGLNVPEYLLASPGRTLAYGFANRQLIITAAAQTGSQAVVGLFLAATLGVTLGAFIFYVPWGRRIVVPPLVALQTTPIVALAPLLTLWIGFGWWAKVIVAAVVAVLPVIIATYSGLGDTKLEHVHLYQLAGASRLAILWHVRLRSAWSAILPALQVATVFSVIGSIVAEFMGGNAGLGFFIMKATYNANGALLLLSVITSALLGQMLLMLVDRMVRPWELRLRG